MTELAVKEQILKEAGYTFEPRREAYINRKVRKVFSIDFIEEHGPDAIASKIHEATPGSEWTFFFNAEPSDSVKRELVRILSA